MRGPDGLAANFRPGSVAVDFSSSDPTSTVAIAVELKAAGMDYADAALSRTPKEAREGTLDTMVGAEDAVFARLQPILATWAGKIVHIGGVGDGHRMKLLNNFISQGYGHPGSSRRRAKARKQHPGGVADQATQLVAIDTEGKALTAIRRHQ